MMPCICQAKFYRDFGPSLLDLKAMLLLMYKRHCVFFDLLIRRSPYFPFELVTVALFPSLGLLIKSMDRKIHNYCQVYIYISLLSILQGYLCRTHLGRYHLPCVFLPPKKLTCSGLQDRESQSRSQVQRPTTHFVMLRTIPQYRKCP